MKWFRAYTDFLSDPKMVTLAFEDQRHFFGICALKAEGVIDQIVPSPDVLNRIVAQRLWIDQAIISEVKKRLQDAGLVDSGWQPIAWNKRQYISDHDATGAERQARYREKQAFARRDGTNNALRNGAVTPPDTDTDTDTDTETDKKNMGQLAGPSAEDLAFNEIQKAYPKREGSQRWATARSSYRARLREKHTHTEILTGTLRYAAYCDAKKITHTALVLQAATFLGTNLGFAESWNVTDVVRRDDFTRLTDAQLVHRCRCAGIGTAGLSRAELISRLVA